MIKKFDHSERPVATIDLTVTNLSQRFSSSDNGTGVVSRFVAEGVLSQYDIDLWKQRQSMMQHKMLGELHRSQSATVLIEKYENISNPYFTESYAQFGGFDQKLGNLRPFVDIYMQSKFFDYVEKAFVMPNPQIKFRLTFMKSNQREGMSLIFNKMPDPIKYSHQGRFTLDSDSETGIIVFLTQGGGPM
jgi:hypothetical protein